MYKDLNEIFRVFRDVQQSAWVFLICLQVSKTLSVNVESKLNLSSYLFSHFLTKKIAAMSLSLLTSFLKIFFFIIFQSSISTAQDQSPVSPLLRWKLFSITRAIITLSLLSNGKNIFNIVLFCIHVLWMKSCKITIRVALAGDINFFLSFFLLFYLMEIVEAVCLPGSIHNK